MIVGPAVGTFDNCTKAGGLEEGDLVVNRDGLCTGRVFPE
jgi:hypothetical protein